MIRLGKFALVSALLLMSAAAQTTTTYTIAPGSPAITCATQLTTNPTYAEICFDNVENYSPFVGSDGSRGDFLCCNVTDFTWTSPVSKAQYCYSGSTWTITPLGGTTYHYAFSCQANPDGTSQDPPVTINLTFNATSITEVVLRYRWHIMLTVWTVNPASVLLTITANP